MQCKIKEVRKKLHMTQADLAKKSGVSRTTIASLENGANIHPSTKTLLKIAQALNTSVKVLFF